MVAPDLPYEDPATTYAERAQRALDALADAEYHDRVVVVGHSLGAGYSPLVAAAHPSSTLVHLCPAPVGPFAQVEAPMRSSHEGFAFPANRPDGTSVWDPAEAIAVMYPRLDPDEAAELAARLKPGSAPADRYPLAEHPRVATQFIYARYDEFFEDEWSRWMAREVAHAEPIEIATGHFPMVEDPGAVAAILLAG